MQPASGASDYAKGDVKTDRFLVECKTTQQRSYTLNRVTLEKIREEAFRVRKEPLLVLTFEYPAIAGAVPATHEDWAVVPYDLLKELLSHE